MADEANIDAYFERIGFAGSIAPILQTLELLHFHHPLAIPFENIDPLLGVPVRLELKNLEQKLLFEKRGGYCFEQNLLFKAALETLGFEVTGLGARVHWGHPPDEERPVSHIVLIVTVGGVRYLADVGFGGMTLTAPLRLRAETEQSTPHETFRLIGSDDEGWRLEVQIGEDWRPVYAFEMNELTAEDFQALNDKVSSGPTFRDHLLAARPLKDRRLALSDGRFRVYFASGESEERTIASVPELREVLGNAFGIALPGTDRLDPALERILGGAAAD